MGSLEKIVEGAFRALLICSAIYFGAKYSPYVLKVADNIKDRIMHGANYSSTSLPSQVKLRDPPISLSYTDPRLYNAILIDNYMTTKMFSDSSNQMKNQTKDYDKFNDPKSTYQRK